MRRCEGVDRPPHHTRLGFRNPPGSPPPARNVADFAAFFWRRAREARRPPVVPAGHALTEAEALAGLAALEGQDSLTWLGHASFLLRLSGLTILTDPFLTRYASPAPGLGPARYVPPGISIRHLPQVDVIVLSHNHYDHLDTRTLAHLSGRERIVAVVPLGLAPYFHERGYRHVRELDWYEGTRVGPLEVTALPAVHFSSRTPFDRDRTLWASFALAAGGRRVWFAGDTGHGPVFREMGATHGPFDLACVPIGAYEPRSIMRPVHCNPEEAVRLGVDLGAKALAAMHWGTVVLTDEPPFEPPERFRAAGLAAGYADERLWVLRVGETRPLAVLQARTAI